MLCLYFYGYVYGCAHAQIHTHVHTNPIHKGETLVPYYLMPLFLMPPLFNN